MIRRLTAWIAGARHRVWLEWIARFGPEYRGDGRPGWESRTHYY